jgi:hypothetical protein
MASIAHGALVGAPVITVGVVHEAEGRVVETGGLSDGVQRRPSFIGQLLGLGEDIHAVEQVPYVVRRAPARCTAVIYRRLIAVSQPLVSLLVLQHAVRSIIMLCALCVCVRVCVRAGVCVGESV